MNRRKDPFKEMTLKFIETTIRRVNQALAMNYATQQALIEAGLITEKRMKQHVAHALQLPTIRVGREALKEMLGGHDIEGKPDQKRVPDPTDREESQTLKRILDMIDTEVRPNEDSDD